MLSTYIKFYFPFLWALNMTIIGAFLYSNINISPAICTLIINFIGIAFYLDNFFKNSARIILNFRSILPLLCILGVSLIIALDAIYTSNIYVYFYLTLYISTAISFILMYNYNPRLIHISITRVIDFIYVTSIIVLFLYILGLYDVLSVNSEFIRKNNESVDGKQLIVFVLGLGQLFVGGSEMNVFGVEIYKYSSYFKEPLHLLVFLYTWLYLKLAYFNQTWRKLDFIMVTILTFWSGSIFAFVMYLIFLSFRIELINRDILKISKKNITIIFFIITASIIILLQSSLADKIFALGGDSFYSTSSLWFRLLGANFESIGAMTLLVNGSNVEDLPNLLSVILFIVVLFFLFLMIFPALAYKKSVLYMLIINILMLLKVPSHHIAEFNLLMALLVVFMNESKTSNVKEWRKR